MGVLTGFVGPVDTSAILRKRITLQGIDVVPASTLKSLIATGIKPVIDRVFPFEKTEATYSAIEGAGHVGKFVIKVAERSKVNAAH